MKNPHPSSTVILGLVLWLGFLPVLYIFPRQELFEVLNAVVFCVAIGVLIGYAPGVWEALKKPLRHLHAGDALQIGIAIGWAATAIVFAVLWYWRLTGKQADIIDHGVTAFSRWMLTTAGFMHLAASGSINGLVPLRSYIKAGIYTAIGLFVGMATIMWIAEPWPPVPN
jgi:hypothetical protein